MKKRSKYRPHTRAWLEKANPVGRAVAMKNLHEDLLDLGITCLSAEHGSQQRCLLARLAYLIGLGAEVAAAYPVEGDNRAGLHQALTEIVRMACNGCTWDASWAAQLQLAADISSDLMLQHQQHAMRAEPAVKGLANRITAGCMRADQVAPLAWPAAHAAVQEVAA